MRRKLLFPSRPVEPNNGQGYFPQDIRRLYNFPANLDGSGQTIGILEFSDGYSLRDARQFWSLHGIPSPSLAFVSVDGTRNDGGVQPADEEASLDLQWAGALAPGAQLVVYEANAGSTYAEFGDAMVRTLQYILNDTTYQPTVLSISYGDAEVNFPTATLEQIASLIQQLSSRGTTVCIASGDQGAYGMHNPDGPKVRHADAPATTPMAVTVGGTTLEPNGAETAWTYLGPEDGGATGGGFSSLFATPAYQAALQVPSRGIPDVSLNADPATGYQIIFQGQPAVVGGTSVSCPVFAAMVALANQQRAQLGKGPLINLTEVLYEAMEGSTRASVGFRDIVAGNNSYNGVTGYAAEPGWDACTGWGSVDAARLIAFLATV
ncbi:MAG: S53 family peptidase [Alicyclobacillus sp.]|nr:S53 family peptidase [Alicyclobacillus sp.]